MSEEALVNLTSAVDRLTLSTDRLTGALENQGSSSAGTPSRPSSVLIAVLEPAGIPFPESFDDICATLRFCGLETGPPETPLACVQHCRSRLTQKPPGPEVRADSAFSAGFWAQVAIECATPYRPRRRLDFASPAHWVVLRSSHPKPFRVVSFRSIALLCNQDDPLLVIEALDSITEVEVFCAGAGRHVPPLKKCESSN